jgi:hypothetical protein
MSHLIGFLRMGHKHQGLYSSLISRLGLLIFKLFRRGPDQLKELVYSVAIMSFDDDASNTFSEFANSACFVHFFDNCAKWDMN